MFQGKAGMRPVMDSAVRCALFSTRECCRLERGMSQNIFDDIDTVASGQAKIKIIGVGGGGGNAVEEMINSEIAGVQFICANTDLQALAKNNAPRSIQLGEKLTRGLGAGADPNKGREAALESYNAIRDVIGDADMIFVTAGMGGGTGTGAAPVVAQAAKEAGALTVGVVTKPFAFEGPKRQRVADEGLEELKKHVDCLIVIPNDRLLAMAPKKTPFSAMLHKANGVLHNAVRSISDVIIRPGLINLDFADVRTTMSQVGLALMGTGCASGENRAREAAQQAIMSPLLEDVSLESAKAILYNVTANEEITAQEISEIGYMIHEAAANDPDINIIFGVVYDEAMEDKLSVTVIATGIEPVSPYEEEVLPQAKVTSFHQPAAPVQPAPRRAPMPQEGLYGDGFVESNAPAAPRPPQQNLRFDERLAPSPYARRHEQLVQQRGVHAPGQEGLMYDDENFEIPTFLRHQAD